MNVAHKQMPLMEDLYVFLSVLHHNNFAKTAAALGVSHAYISKRIKILENTLNTQVFHRNTRRLVLTDDGSKLEKLATQLLDNMDELLFQMALSKQEISGEINICSSFGLGINFVSKAISAFSKTHPKVNANLHLIDQEIDLASSGFHLEIRVGDPLSNHNIAKLLATNHRVLCAAPSYLKQQGTPKKLMDLKKHHCLFIQEKNQPFGIWQLEKQGVTEAITVKSSLTSNSGSVSLQWSLDGHGIILRSLWHVQKHLATGQLVQILPAYSQPANIWAVYPNKLSQSAKLKTCVEFFSYYFQEHFNTK